MVNDGTPGIQGIDRRMLLGWSYGGIQISEISGVCEI